MNTRAERFLTLYRTYRHEDQRAFYDSRRAEFEDAHEQGVDLAAWLMAGSTVVAALAAANIGGLQTVWSVLCVILPTMSSALTAYDKLYAFDQQAKLYGDAAIALQRARVDSPDLQGNLTEAQYTRALSAYLQSVEGVFRREQGQWGQLISELKTVEPETGEPRPEV
ncbi:MAG TPA: SLATT domain-containing protein [Chloroflexota bacterium]|nr:SLATT domain-containing protein [Chloroflexota bacterium]